METKKNPSKDYRKKSALFFNLGLVISITLVISAFEMKFEDTMSYVDRPVSDFGGITIDIPSTVMPEKTLPPRPVVNIIQVKDDQPIEEEIDIPDLFPEEIPLDAPPIITEKLPEEQVDVDWVGYAEQMPSSSEDFLKYVGKNIKYPGRASRLNVEGKVFVQFVVSKDGTMKDIRIVRGLGYGCDEEVLRVMQMPYKWTPGKQRGIPVNVRMILPITFSLQK